MHRQLNDALASLKQSINCDKLTGGTLLPAAMTAPRPQRPINVDSSVDKLVLTIGANGVHQSNEAFSVFDGYAFNPLMTITPYRNPAKEAAKDGESDDEEEEEDEEEDVATDDDLAQRDQYEQYVLHHLFGNDSLESAYRVVLRVPPAVVATFESLIAQHSDADDGVPAWRLLQLPGDQHSTAAYKDDKVQLLHTARCFFVLRQLGFVYRCQSARMRLRIGTLVRTLEGALGTVRQIHVDGKVSVRLSDGDRATVQIARSDVETLQRVPPVGVDEPVVVVRGGVKEGLVARVIGNLPDHGKFVVKTDDGVMLFHKSVLSQFRYS